jgi:hypothetical protein
MGWCEGSHICENIWLKVREYVPEEKRASILGEMIDVFSDGDADCWGEVLYDCPEYKEAMKLADLYDLYFDDD